MPPNQQNIESPITYKGRDTQHASTFKRERLQYPRINAPFFAIGSYPSRSCSRPFRSRTERKRNVYQLQTGRREHGTGRGRRRGRRVSAAKRPRNCQRRPEGAVSRSLAYQSYGLRGQVFPDAKYQRCTVHFYRNVLSSVPNQKIGSVSKMLKAIHAQEDKAAAREKAKQVVEKLRAMKLGKAAKTVEAGFEETLTFMSFPSQHWIRIRTNNALERLNREIKRRTKVVGTFPDGESALMLVCARLRHVASSAWGSKRYLNMEHLKSMILSEEEGLIAG